LQIGLGEDEGENPCSNFVDQNEEYTCEMVWTFVRVSSSASNSVSSGTARIRPRPRLQRLFVKERVREINDKILKTDSPLSGRFIVVIK
jgi:hypothetical protein